MSTGKCSLVVGLFNQNSPVPKASVHLSSHSPSQGVKAAHSTSSKRKLHDENDLNVGNEIIDQIVTEKESPQAYGPPILENLASAVTKFWETEARNEQKIKKLKNEFLVASNSPKFYVPTLNEEIIKNKSIYHYYKRNDHSDSKQFLRDDLADNVKKSKATHFMNPSISNKRLRLSSSSPRNPKFLYSSNSKTSTSSSNSSNFQGCNKNIQRPQPTASGIRSNSLK